MAAIQNKVFFKNIVRLAFFPKLYQVRHNYIGQPIKEEPVLPRKYEVSRDPEEWKFVTRLLNQKTVPPLVEKKEYASGWVPPQDIGRTQPYFVERTKNHMLPLYIANERRGQLKVTVVKKVQGDIWKLHRELKEHVEKIEGRKIASQVLECNSVIKFKGDRFHWVEQFLLDKGF